MRQTGVMITDCLSCLVCQDTAEDHETLNLHVTALTMFQDAKLQDIHHQTLLDPQLVKLARVIQMVGVTVVGNWMQTCMCSGYTDSTSHYKQHHYEWFKNLCSKVLTTRISPMFAYGTSWYK